MSSTDVIQRQITQSLEKTRPSVKEVKGILIKEMIRSKPYAIKVDEHTEEESVEKPNRVKGDDSFKLGNSSYKQMKQHFVQDLSLKDESVNFEKVTADLEQ